MAKKKSAPRKSRKQRQPLTAEETYAWLKRYRRHSRIYSWGFFTVLQPIVFGVIWWSMGEMNNDVWYSWAFFAFVTLLLALNTRRNANRKWVGRVERKYIKEIRRRNENGPDNIEHSPIVEVRTRGGRLQKIRGGARLFEYFNEGDEVFKVSGFEWPQKAVLEDGRGICMICGNFLEGDPGSCDRCGGPVPDHNALRASVGLPPAPAAVPSR